MLEVPICLPDSEPIHLKKDRISDSYTANTPDYRTMNPEDRFMNPRQPPKPKMPPRVRTSLQQPAPAWNFRNSPLSMITNRTTSLPSSPTDKPRSRNSRESFVSKSSRSLSPPRSRGMHGALHCLNATTPNQPIAKYKEFDVTRPGAAHGPGPRRGDQQHQHVAAHPHPRGFHLPFPRNHEPLSIQDRRALKSKPRDPSPFRNPLTVNTRSDRVETAFSHQNDVPSLRAIAQEIAVSGDSTTPTPFGFKDKRLPTLPNTPSSVMDEALEDLEERERALAAEKLESHFSDFSATDESSGSHSPRYEKSRFSEWSADTDQQQHPSGSFNSLPSFPRVEHPPSPVFEDVETPSYLRPAHAHGHAHAHAADCSDPDTPHLTVNSQPSPAISMPSNSPDLQLPVPRVAVAGSGSPGGDLDISNLSVQDDDHDGNDHADDNNDDDASSHVETNPKRHAAFFGAFDPVKGLGLSSSNPENSRRILSEAVERERAAVPGGVPGSGSGSGRDEKSRDGHPSQSATMKEMMDELSYLKNMIQSEQGGMI